VVAAVVRVQVRVLEEAAAAAQVDSVLHRAFRYRLGLDIRSQSAAAVLEVLPLTLMEVSVLHLFFHQYQQQAVDLEILLRPMPAAPEVLVAVAVQH
jgi:hypothetical protein